MPSLYGRPEPSAKPAAAGAPVSGTGTTMSASTGASAARATPIRRRASYSLRPSMFEPAQDQRPEADGIAYTDDALLVEDGQRIGPLHKRQHPLQRLDGVGRRIVGQQRRQQFGVGRGRKAGLAA